MVLTQNTLSVCNSSVKDLTISKNLLTTKYIDQLSPEEKDSLKNFDCGNEDHCSYPNMISKDLLILASNSPEKVVFLCYLEEVVGYIYLSKDYSPRPSKYYSLKSGEFVINVYSLAIHKSYQDQEIGSFFLNQIISGYVKFKDINPNCGLKGMCGLTTNPHAKKLYLNLGAEQKNDSIFILPF